VEGFVLSLLHAITAMAPADAHAVITSQTGSRRMVVEKRIA
jgi:hypothetical protein